MGEVMGEGGSTRDGLPGSSDGLGRGRMEKKKEEDGKCDGVDMIIIFFFGGDDMFSILQNFNAG